MTFDSRQQRTGRTDCTLHARYLNALDPVAARELAGALTDAADEIERLG